MHRVRLLRHHRIEPYIVFDGGPLPAKKGTESERKKKREENLERANQLTRNGKPIQARDCYVKCVDVTPQMAYQLIKVRSGTLPAICAYSDSSCVLGVEGRDRSLRCRALRGGCSDGLYGANRPS